MFRRTKKVQWENKFINNIFESANIADDSYIDILLKNPESLNSKNIYLPNNLYKFCRPSYDNIIDLKNGNLWFSHPSSFNDLYDCSIGYDKDEFERKTIIELIKSKKMAKRAVAKSMFTKDDYNAMLRSASDYDKSGWRWGNDGKYKIEHYSDAFENILKSKSPAFRTKVKKQFREKCNQLDEKVKVLSKTNIRVACFANFDKYDDFPKMAQMWAHYADDHKGFCIEFDMSSFKNELKLTTDYYYDNESDFLSERLSLAIKGGLFPVNYSSKRIKMPYSKLKLITEISDSEISKNNYFESLLLKAYINKSTVWNYEKEWRIILDEKICNYYENKIPFPYAKCVYIGVRMEKKKKDLLIQTARELGIEVRIMRTDRDKYLLEDWDTWFYEYDEKRKKDRHPYK